MMMMIVTVAGWFSPFFVVRDMFNDYSHSFFF